MPHAQTKRPYRGNRRRKLNPDLSDAGECATPEPGPCFRIIGGRLVPILPRDDDGSVIVPDGLDVLGVEHVADRLGLQPRWVQLIYADTFQRVVVLPIDISYVD